MVPWEDQNSIIKGRDGLRGKGSEKKRETQKRRDFLDKKTISKSVVKRKKKKKNTKGKTNIASRYPVKATIAHTRIQRESNFASFEG